MCDAGSVSLLRLARPAAFYSDMRCGLVERLLWERLSICDCIVEAFSTARSTNIDRSSSLLCGSHPVFEAQGSKGPKHPQTEAKKARRNLRWQKPWRDVPALQISCCFAWLLFTNSCSWSGSLRLAKLPAPCPTPMSTLVCQARGR